MKKNVLKILFCVFAALMLPCVVSAELYCENTPEENVFYVGGRGFILLDKGEIDGENAYLILSKDFYDLRYYGGVADDADSSTSWNAIDHYFDVSGTSDPYNVGYWLNTDFIGRIDGTGLPVIGEKKMADYIPGAVWKTEACSVGSNCPVTESGSVTKYYDVNAKIVLPSREEINKYADKIGYSDGASSNWWTRSKYYAYNDKKIVSAVNNITGAFAQKNGGKLLTRPMFYLKESFFSEIRIETENVGENVRTIFKTAFTEDELSGLYTQNELDILFLEGEYNAPESVVRENMVYIYGSLDTTYKNRNVSVLALKKGADSNNPLSSQILYLNQTKVDENGDYEIIFDAKNSNFDIYISDGGNLKKQLLFKDYTQKHYVRCTISDAEHLDNYIYNITAEMNNVFSDSDAVCDIYLAKYDEGGRLCGVEKQSFNMSGENKIRVEDINFTTDNNTSVVKAFVWSELIPLNEEKTLLDIDLNKITKLTVATNKVGNIYTDNDVMSFKVNGEMGKTVRYSLYDFHKNEVATGTFVLESENYNWELPYSGYGYFTLNFKYEYYNINNTVSQVLCRVTDENFDNVQNSPFGINAHLEWTQYGFDPALVNYMALMGARSIRTGYSWSGAEKEQGVYEINTAGLAEMRAHNMRMNLVTGYGNDLYNGQKWFPWSDEGRKAFSNYQLGLMEHVGDLVDELDVWNEWYGGGDSNNWYYYALLKECYAPFKTKYPEVDVLGNASTDSVHAGWYDKLLGYGAADYMDGIYPHIYYHNSEPEETILSAKDFYDNIHEKYNAKYGTNNLKMYLTETGATTCTGTGVSEEEQASRLVRAYAIGLYCGYEKIYWYDFMNDGATQAEREDNFGLVRHAYDSKGKFTPKPAYVAYAVMARQLTGYSCTGLKMLGDNSDIYCVTFEKDNETVNVVWSLNEQKLSLGSEMSVTDIMGETENVSELDIGRYPLYLHGII